MFKNLCDMIRDGASYETLVLLYLPFLGFASFLVFFLIKL